MSNKIRPELQKQIKKEATSSAANFHYYPGSEQFEDMESVYETGAFKYAEKWQEEIERAERYEKALKEIKGKAMDGIFPSIPIENMGAQMCVEIEKMVIEALTPKTSTDDTDNG